MSAVAEQEQYEGEGEFEDEAVLGESNPELDAMKSKLAEIEAEARKLEEMQEQVDGLAQSSVDKEEVDSRSVFVGNVDFGTKPAELQQHFEACGAILRVTILCDKWTGHPKGFAYVEFMEQESVPRAVELNESIFRGRPLKVVSKRTNQPGMGRRRRRAAVGGFRGRGSPRRRPRRTYGYQPY